MKNKVLDYLRRRDVKRFPQPVQDALLLMVNEEGFRFRMPDNMHILVYPADTSQRPLKVAASREVKQSLYYLEQLREGKANGGRGKAHNRGDN